MLHPVYLPKLGDNVRVTVVNCWRVAPGDLVKAGDPLMSVQTDKVDADVESPVAGRIVELLVQDGDEAEMGVLICTIDTSQIPH